MRVVCIVLWEAMIGFYMEMIGVCMGRIVFCMGRIGLGERQLWCYTLFKPRCANNDAKTLFTWIGIWEIWIIWVVSGGAEVNWKKVEFGWETVDWDNCMNSTYRIYTTSFDSRLAKINSTLHHYSNNLGTSRPFQCNHLHRHPKRQLTLFIINISIE